MAKSEFYLGAAKVDGVTAQNDTDAVRIMVSALGIPSFDTVEAAKAGENAAWSGKIRYIRVTVETVEE